MLPDMLEFSPGKTILKSFMWKLTGSYFIFQVFKWFCNVRYVIGLLALLHHLIRLRLDKNDSLWTFTFPALLPFPPSFIASNCLFQASLHLWVHQYSVSDSISLSTTDSLSVCVIHFLPQGQTNTASALYCARMEWVTEREKAERRRRRWQPS